MKNIDRTDRKYLQSENIPEIGGHDHYPPVEMIFLTVWPTVDPPISVMIIVETRHTTHIPNCVEYIDLTENITAV